MGLLGDVKSLDGDIHEIRIDFGPGWRIYYIQHQKTIIFLLTGGAKKTQRRDIEKAQVLASKIHQPKEKELKND